ncbi:hypothetical protein [Myroides sp. N17-2]|nr:hypothetical protein [Myroides sp. N17-2]
MLQQKVLLAEQSCGNVEEVLKERLLRLMSIDFREAFEIITTIS